MKIDMKSLFLGAFLGLVLLFMFILNVTGSLVNKPLILEL